MGACGSTDDTIQLVPLGVPRQSDVSESFYKANKASKDF